jgi:hypothetical protein
MLTAATVNTNQDSYTPNQEIVVSFTEMEARTRDCIGIYPVNSTNDWGNQVQWKWTDDKEAGNVVFEHLPVGTYEVRVFYNNSFISETSKQIKIEKNAEATTVKTNKDTYLVDEKIVATFANMSGNQADWIAIYPVGSTNAWANMLQWSWIEDELKAGTHTFEAMPIGDYEVRVFFNNSFNDEAIAAFSVEQIANDLALEKEAYDPFELIHVNYNHMRGVNGDWIGIFAVGADHLKESAIEWRDSKSLVSGQLSFNGLPSGVYEARSYFNDVHHKTIEFTVQNKVRNRVVYDDFEDEVINPRWVRFSGPDMTISNRGVSSAEIGNTERKVIVAGQHSILLKADYRNGLNHAGYYFNFENPDSKLKFLELDVSIQGVSHSSSFGVKVKTKLGDRRIEFASWLNHNLPNGKQVYRGPYGNVLPGHMQTFTRDNYAHMHPAPSDYAVGSRVAGGGENMFVHFKINIEEKLRLLEPDNELLGITLFVSSGGYYDNLALSSQ